MKADHGTPGDLHAADEERYRSLEQEALTQRRTDVERQVGDEQERGQVHKDTPGKQVPPAETRHRNDQQSDVQPCREKDDRIAEVMERHLVEGIVVDQWMWPEHELHVQQQHEQNARDLLGCRGEEVGVVHHLLYRIVARAQQRHA